MLDVYTWGTPNGLKPLLLLEETGLTYRLHRVDLRAGANKLPAFLALNPNGKIPVIVDHEGQDKPLVLAESGAILWYLADKSDLFGARYSLQRYAMAQWLFFQAASIGPTFGQLATANREGDASRHVADRLRVEANRLLGVLEAHLAAQLWLAEDYSIADMATFGWIRATDFVGLDLTAYPNVQRWRNTIAGRASVQRALALFDL